MQKVNMKLQLEGNQHFLLRSILGTDLEDLRLWKNQNKQFFFHQAEITYDQQKKWFEGFQNRSTDFMFIVEEVVSLQSIGCMGFRFLEDEKTVDVYNIMRGVKSVNNVFSMGEAFQTMINYILTITNLPISCKVLRNNPALEWYSHNYFEGVESIDDFNLLMLNKNKFPVKSILVTEIEELYFRV